MLGARLQDFAARVGRDQRDLEARVGRLELAPGGAADWSSLTGKPTAFPPLTHVHVIADVSGLQAALDGKQNVGAGGASGVSAFNTRSGAVTLTSGDVTDALGFTPQAAGSYLTANQAITLSGDASGSGATAIAVTIASASGSTKGLMSAADFTKLAGVATGATANSADATLLARANHTGTQSLDTTTDSATRLALTAAERTKLGNLSGTNTGDQTTITGNAGSATVLQTARTINGVSFNGSANITINAVDATARVAETRAITTTAPLTGGGDLTANRTLAISAATTGAAGSMSAADKSKLDGVASGATANATDAQLRDRSTHTGTQAPATIAFAATARLLGRTTAGAGSGEELDQAAVRSFLGLGTAAYSASGAFQPAGSYLTGNQTITLSGDALGSGATAITVTLATVNASPGSYGSSSSVPVITVDAKGRITAVSATAISGGGSGAVRTFYSLANAHTNSTVTPSTIGNATADVDWVHTLVAGKAYRFVIWGQYQSVALTTGGRMNLLGAGGLAGTVSGMMWGGIQQAAAASTLEVPIFSFANGTGAFLLTTAVAPINSPHTWGADFVFVCSTGGTLALQWASEVAASAAQLNAGTCMLVEELN